MTRRSVYERTETIIKKLNAKDAATITDLLSMAKSDHNRLAKTLDAIERRRKAEEG